MPAGFYADINYNCRIFHVCENSGNGFPVICANDTVFDQKQRICTDEENIDCQHAHEWYVHFTIFRSIGDQKFLCDIINNYLLQVLLE